MIKKYRVNNWLFGRIFNTNNLSWLVAEEQIQPNVKIITLNIPEPKEFGDPSVLQIHNRLIKMGAKEII
jgi:hypothetical protein